MVSFQNKWLDPSKNYLSLYSKETSQYLELCCFLSFFYMTEDLIQYYYSNNVKYNYYLFLLVLLFIKYIFCWKMIENEFMFEV